jgi:hypothetical protein
MCNKIKINIDAIINFYDSKDSTNSKHASSISGVIGEDLGAGLIKHYFENCLKVNECKIIDDTPKTKGNWLDRWIIVEDTKTIYQTEIKNWSSHSLGGKNITNENLCEQSKNYFPVQKENLEKTEPNNVNKVLLKMNLTDKVIPNHSEYKHKAMICYWFPISDNSTNICNECNDLPPFIFNVTAMDTNKQDMDTNKQFNELTFFSMSLYLRCLQKKGMKDVEIYAPNIVERWTRLNNFLKLV